MIIYNLILLILFVTVLECHDYHQQQNHGVKGRTGHNIKSYGGYFHDTTGFNEAADNFVHSQDYHRPQTVPYQPYGWNFNQPRRTYGGVNMANHQSDYNGNRQLPSNHIGWANNNNFNRLNPFPFFPPLPQSNFFFPNIPNMFPYTPNLFPYANSYPHSGSNYPGDRQGYPLNNQGSPVGNPLPYPQTNQGMPMPNNNRQPYFPQNSYGNDNRNPEGTQPGQLPYPQVNPGMPTPGHFPQTIPTNVGSNAGQLPYPQSNSNSGMSNTAGSSNLMPNRGQYPNSQGGNDLGTTQIPIEVSSDRNIGTNDHDYQRPVNPILPNQVDPSADIDVRLVENVPNRLPGSSNKNQEFASNSFFGNNDDRQWTQDDEQKWQATTKRPYFENKVPGLECTLPAAAVLVAQDAFKASSLFPLNIPAGKPILSCNATNLLQSQIRLNGKIYDCDQSEVTLSCPNDGTNVDKCQTQKVQCDVENNNVDVWCTNGTVVSSSNVVCQGASLLPSKSILNCELKQQPKTTSGEETTTLRTTLINVLPLRNNGNNPNQNVNENGDYFIDFEESEEDSDIQAHDLMPQVKSAMQNVFPHDLLTMRSNKYLPPKVAMQTMDPNLKNHIKGVFNVDLLALSQNEDEINPPIISNDENIFNAEQSTPLIQQNWNFNPNRNAGATDLRASKTVTRFGGDNQQNHNLQDRLIFTD